MKKYYFAGAQFKRRFCQVLSLLISVALIFSSSEFVHAAVLPSTPASLINLANFSIPGNLGMIMDAYRSGNDKRFVFVVQDLHIHPPVQKKIRDLLGFLIKQPQLKNTRLIGVEGAEGQIPTMAEASRPNPALKRKVADFLIEQGELTGAEAFAIEHGRGDLLWGVENDKYYQADRYLYVMTLKARKELRQRLDFLDARLTEVTNRKLKQPAAVKEVARIEKALEQGMMQPTAVLRTWLKQGANLPLKMRPYPRLRALANVIEVEEQGGHSQLVNDARNFISVLGPYLMAPERRELEKLGKSDPELYYLRLVWLARERHLEGALPPTLRGYAAGLSGIRDFSAFDVEQELLTFAPEFKAFLSKDKRSQNAFLAQKSLRFLARYLSQQATDYEVMAWTRHMQEMIARVKALGLLSDQEVNELTHRISNQIDFYSLALVRNEPMIKNLLAEMKLRDSSETAVLVAGGFHTRGLTDVLRKSGVSYIVLTPTVEEDFKAEYSALYEQRLADDHLNPAEIEKGVSKTLGISIPNAISVFLGGAVRAARVKLGFDIGERSQSESPLMARSEGRRDPYSGLTPKARAEIDRIMGRPLNFMQSPFNPRLANKLKEEARSMTMARIEGRDTTNRAKVNLPLVLSGAAVAGAGIYALATGLLAAIPGGVIIVAGLGLVIVPLVRAYRERARQRTAFLVARAIATAAGVHPGGFASDRHARIREEVTRLSGGNAANTRTTLEAAEMARTIKRELESAPGHDLLVSAEDLRTMEDYFAGRIDLAQSVSEISSMAESDSAKLLIAGKVCLQNNFYAVGRSALLAFLAGDQSDAEIDQWARNLTHDGHKLTLAQAKNILRGAKRAYEEVVPPSMARSEGAQTLRILSEPPASGETVAAFKPIWTASQGNEDQLRILRVLAAVREPISVELLSTFAKITDRSVLDSTLAQITSVLRVVEVKQKDGGWKTRYDFPSSLKEFVDQQDHEKMVQTHRVIADILWQWIYGDQGGETESAGSEGLPQTREEFFAAVRSLYSPSGKVFSGEADYYRQKGLPKPKDIGKAYLSQDEQVIWDQLTGIFDNTFQRSELRNTGETFRSSFRLFDSSENSTVTIMPFGNRTVFYVNRRFLENLLRLKGDLQGHTVIPKGTLPKEVDHLPSVDLIDSILYAVAFHEMGHHWDATTKPNLKRGDKLEMRFMSDGDEQRLQTFRGGDTYGIFNTAAYKFYLRYARVSTTALDKALARSSRSTQDSVQEVVNSLGGLLSPQQNKFKLANGFSDRLRSFLGRIPDLLGAGKVKTTTNRQVSMARSEGRTSTSIKSASIASRLWARAIAIVRSMVNFFHSAWTNVVNYFSAKRAAKLARRTALTNLTNTPQMDGVPLPVATSDELGQVADPETAQQAKVQRAGLLAMAAAA